MHVFPFQTVARVPPERYATTYSRDYKPSSERHLQVSRPKPRTEAAPAFISPPQTPREFCPVFHQCSYGTTNNIYGSSSCSQPPSCSLFPPSRRPFGILAPSEASGVVGSSLTEVRIQEVGATVETGPVLCEEENGQLCCVFGGEADVLEQREAKDEPQQRIDVLYEEGVIELSSHVGPACCEDFHGPVYRDAFLQHLLHLPVTKDAEWWDDSTYLRGFGPALELRNSTFRQPATSRQCSCRSWRTPRSNSCIPRSSSSTLVAPPARVPPTFYNTQPSRRPLLTEYQARYSPELRDVD